MPGSDEAVNAAAELIKEIQDEDAAVEGGVTLSTGVTLKPKRFPLWALRDAQRKIKEPDVPFYFNQEKEREEPNPEDPGYVAAYNEYENKLSDVALNIALMLGCEVVSVPDGMEGPDGEQWIDDCVFLEVLDDDQAAAIRQDPRKRRITWLRYFAISDEHDIAKVMAGPMKKTLVAEEDVAESMRSFPNRETRRAAARGKAQENGRNGD